MVQGRLKVVGNGFTLDGTPFQIIGATMYTLFFNWAYGGQEDFVAEMIRQMRATSIQTPRIFVTVDQDSGWGDGSYTGYPVVLNPSDHPNFYGKLNAFAKMMLEEGFYPEYVVFGSCVDGFDTQDERTTVCLAVGNVLYQYPCLVEISPDPVATELGREGISVGVDPFDEAQRLVSIYKSVDAQNPVAAAGGTFTASDVNRPYADFIGYAPDRLIGDDKWEWVTAIVTSSPNAVNGNPRATICEFPMCAEGNPDIDQNDGDTAHWWAYGLLSQFLQMGSMFHSQQLLGSFLTYYLNYYQLTAWRDGRLTVAWKDFPQFYVTEGITGASSVGDSPWIYTDALMVYGRHNGVTGMAVAMRIPDPWTPTDGLQAGWTAEIIEQRGDAALVGLMQA